MIARNSSEAFWLKPPGPVAKGLKIGLLGGSFNPAHEGHLHASETALKRLGLDYVWWLVAQQNPLKPVAGMAPLCRRLAFAARQYEHHPRIAVVDAETALGTHYTIDTLEALRRRFPAVRFVWLMGSDNLEKFQLWKRWPDILATVPVAVIARPGSDLAPLRSKAAQRFAHARISAPRRLAATAPPAFALLEGRCCSQSATALRARNIRDEGLLRAPPPC